MTVSAILCIENDSQEAYDNMTGRSKIKAPSDIKLKTDLAGSDVEMKYVSVFKQ